MIVFERVGFEAYRKKFIEKGLVQLVRCTVLRAVGRILLAGVGASTGSMSVLGESGSIFPREFLKKSSC